MRLHRRNSMKQLAASVNKALDDIPNDLWLYHGNDPDPRTTSPHEFFSGVGVSYFESLLNFVGNEEVFIELSDPGSEYPFLGESPKRPGV